jgi:hypothetical protein
MKNFTTYTGFFYVFLSSKSSRKFGPQATLAYLADNILRMAILGGWVPD